MNEPCPPEVTIGQSKAPPIVIFRTDDGAIGLELADALPRNTVELLFWNRETGLYDSVPLEA